MQRTNAFLNQFLILFIWYKITKLYIQISFLTIIQIRNKYNKLDYGVFLHDIFFIFTVELQVDLEFKEEWDWGIITTTPTTNWKVKKDMIWYEKIVFDDQYLYVYCITKRYKKIPKYKIVFIFIQWNKQFLTCVFFTAFWLTLPTYEREVKLFNVPLGSYVK